MALDLVTHETKFKSIFEFVLGNTIVVDDIDTTRKIGIGKARMVTMTGDLVEPSGSMTGGHRVQRRGMGFIEQDVSGKIEKLEAELADKQTVISALEARRKDFEERIARLRELKHTLEGEIIKEEKALHLDTADLEASRVQKKKIQDELKEIETELRNIQSKLIIKNRDLTGAKTERQKLRDQITAMRNPRVLAELNSFEDKRRELKDEIMTVQGEIRSMESESTNILKPELEKTQSILKQHDKELQGFQKEKIALDALIKTQDKELTSKEKAEKEFYAQFKDLFQKRSKISDQVTKLEAENNAKSGSIREVENKSNAFALENAKTKAELAGLEEEYKPYMGLELFETKKDETIKREISEFEKMMQDLGAVNMKALDIYEEVEKSYHELMGKKSSLQKEREDVLVMINEIDSKKQELFIKTFDVLNEHFKTIFGRLSTKGDAFLELENPQQPFEGGTTIKVRLIGKKFLDIRSLSGGEKTLTALAFIFSVQEHAPASFYILDEVDAALDKRNSEKLAELVKAYSSRAQYVMISHNDNVITSADNLYGISMNKDGTSKVTTLKI
jgi:chromosome segregation protein